MIEGGRMNWVVLFCPKRNSDIHTSWAPGRSQSGRGSRLGGEMCELLDGAIKLKLKATVVARQKGGCAQGSQ